MPFACPVRVRFCETDLQKIVHHSIYFQYFEVARVEFFRKLGFLLEDLSQMGFDLLVRDASIHYKRPAYYDDLLDIELTVKTLRPASVEFTYRVLRRDKVLTTGATMLACVGKKGRPVGFPDHFRAALLDSMEKETQTP